MDKNKMAGMAILSSNLGILEKAGRQFGTVRSCFQGVVQKQPEDVVLDWAETALDSPRFDVVHDSMEYSERETMASTTSKSYS